MYFYLLRFLLVLLFNLSFINTVWCIFTSPYLNGNVYEEEGELITQLDAP